MVVLMEREPPAAGEHDEPRDEDRPPPSGHEGGEAGERRFHDASVPPEPV